MGKVAAEKGYKTAVTLTWKYAAGEESTGGFKETFDQLYAEGQAGSPKWIEMTLHCHMAGRPTLVPTIRQCIAYAQRHEGVWYARKRDIAEWALEPEGQEG